MVKMYQRQIFVRDISFLLSLLASPGWGEVARSGATLLLLRPPAFKSGRELDTLTCKGHGSVELIL